MYCTQRVRQLTEDVIHTAHSPGVPHAGISGKVLLSPGSMKGNPIRRSSNASPTYLFDFPNLARSA